MNERLAKLPELVKNHTDLAREKTTLQKQVRDLTTELAQTKDSGVKQNKELATLTEALQEVRSQNEGLEVENDNLLSKQKKVDDEAKKATQAFAIVKNENTKLNEMVDKLKASQGAANGSHLSSKPDQESRILELEGQKETLQKALDEWTALAKVSTVMIHSIAED